MADQINQSILPNRRIRKPIIVIGCARSATTMMGRILSHHPDVDMWHELRMIWMYRNAYQPHDELSAKDLTPRIARHIDRKFARHLERSGRRRFAEKTPSNCFRIPFIHALYPDCRIINIIRDGRNVVRSMLRVQEHSKPDRNVHRFKKRIAHTPLWEWPAYLPRFFRTFWRARILGKPMKIWGPLPRDWQQWQNLPRHLIVTEQWRRSVEASIRDGRALPSDNYFEIRYEALMQRPIDIISEMLEFTALPRSDEVLEYVERHIDPNRTHRWEGTLAEEQEREIVERIGPLLEELGYDRADEAIGKPDMLPSRTQP